MALDPRFVVCTFDSDSRFMLGSGMDGAVYQLTVLANGVGGAASLGGGALKVVRNANTPPDPGDDTQWETVNPGLDALAIGFTYDVSLAFPGLGIELAGATAPDVIVLWTRRG